MAYFVNPDGTITPVNVAYNSDGSLKIVHPYKSDFQYDGINYEKNKSSKKSKKNKSKNKNRQKYRKVETSKVYATTKESNIKSNEKEIDNPNSTIVKTQSQKIDLSDMSIRDILKGFDISSKTISSVFPSPPKIDQGRRKRKRKKKNKNKDNKVNNYNKHNLYASSAISYDEASNFVHKGNKPKYAYARDIFGRIKEKDHFNEDRKNEFEQAKKKQSNYDYSNFDIEDDNDGAYGSFE